MKRTNALISIMLLPMMMVTELYASELIIYSSRNASYIKPLLNDYSQDTGVEVLYVIGSAPQLMRRLEKEGARGSADLFLTAGAATLAEAEEKGLLASVSSKTLERNVQENLRSTNNQWFALSKRARTIVYNSKNVSEDELSSYEDLASAKWKGRLCLRSANDDYTRSLIAMMTARNGAEKTQAVIEGWLDNLAVAPFQDDMFVLDAIHQGVCDVGIVNSYYYGRFGLENPKNTVKIFWANQKSNGVYIDITGLGLTAHSKNKAQAIDFMEWLSGKRPQSYYGKLSYEYPSNPKVNPIREVAKWGEFKEDKQPVSNAKTYQQQALELIKTTEYQ